MVNLVNLERVSKSYGVRPLLADVSLGVAEGQRIGVVGRNGDGKTTLLEVMTGQEPPDSGRVSSPRGMLVGFLHQHDALVDTHSVREAVLAGRADHEWAADPRTREIVEELLAGVTLDRAVLGLSGGERRRCALAALLLGDHDLIVLDEPTNHLDVEAVDWLARHLAARPSALVVVTHDRWFLDAVCQWTWEVHDGAVDAYEGGYAAYILAKAERQRQASATEERRQNLVRKELAWLRRGPPARTSKPKFRIDAANSLIEDVPPPRDRFELQRFAAQRLGKDVLDVEDVDLVRGERALLHHATWRLGPGDRVGIVGVNGAGKTSVLGLLDGSIAPSAGRVRHGRTVSLQHLTQDLDDLDPEGRVLPTLGVGQARHPHGDRRDHRDLDAGAVRLLRRPSDHSDRRPVRRREAALPAAATADDRAQRAAARRADQRPRHRHPERPGGFPRRAGRARSSWSPTTATSSSASPTRCGRCSATGRSRCCRAVSRSTSGAGPPSSPRPPYPPLRHLRADTAATPRVEAKARPGSAEERAARKVLSPAWTSSSNASPSRRPPSTRRSSRPARTTSGSPSCPRSCRP